MDCQWCYRQHLNFVNNYTALGFGGELVETINTPSHHFHLSYLQKLKKKPFVLQSNSQH